MKTRYAPIPVLLAFACFGTVARPVAAQETLIERFDAASVPAAYRAAWDKLQQQGGYCDPAEYQMMQIGSGYRKGDRVALAVEFSGMGKTLQNGLHTVLFSTWAPEARADLPGRSGGVVAALYAEVPAAIDRLDEESPAYGGWIFARYQGASGGIPVLVPELTVFPRIVLSSTSQKAAELPGDVGSLAILDLTLSIGLLVPLSGPVPSFGVSVRDGALLAIEEWNARGGVLARKVVPIVEDGQCRPGPAVEGARRLIDRDKVRYIVGEVCSSASIPVSEIANGKQVIQISPTSTNTLVTVGSDGATKPYIFRACFIDPFQGMAAAWFALGRGWKKAFVMADPANDYVRGLADAFRQVFEAKGGEIVGRATYTARDTDFSAILEKVKAANPDVVYLPDYYNIVNLVTKQARRMGITVPFVGGDGWDSSDLDLAAADGCFFANHYSPASLRPEAMAFRKTWAAKHNGQVPDALAALAYDTTNLLLRAIEEAGTDDTGRVKAALEQIRFSGVTGRLTFDASHNPVKSVFILAVRGGRIVLEAIIDP